MFYSQQTTFVTVSPLEQGVAEIPPAFSVRCIIKSQSEGYYQSYPSFTAIAVLNMSMVKLNSNCWRQTENLHPKTYMKNLARIMCFFTMYYIVQIKAIGKKNSVQVHSCIFVLNYMQICRTLTIWLPQNTSFPRTPSLAFPSKKKKKKKKKKN